ncbi:MAG: type I polyketide synthase, partial [Phaeodactylibacter sp.]|nr:type I polyketide synthase [Phaeodactylibacter sp.]
SPSLSLNEQEQGWLVGEGAGAVVLKKLSDAGEDQIYAVIEGIGKARQLPEGGYLELAATGINREDEAERKQLLEQLPQAPTALGSIKANIGHTYAASGIAGLIKTALCLHHRFIPGIPNWTGPKDTAAFENSGYYFPERSRPWILEKGQEKRRAAVNGTGGIQLQLSEAAQSFNSQPAFLQKNTPQLFLLKGQSAKELKQQLSALEIAAESPAALEEIAAQFHHNDKAKARPYCIALIANHKKGLLQDVRFFQKSIESAISEQKVLKTPGGSYFTPRPLGGKGKVAFVYPGSSTAYTHLGQDLFQLFPQLFPHFEKMLPGLDEYIWPDYLFPKKIRSGESPKNIYQDAIAMMSIGVFFSTAYTHILRAFFRIEPEVAFGYSMGECSSMWYSLGIWSADETKEFQESPIFKNRFAGNLELLAEHWGITTEEAKNRWVSLVLLAPREEVERLVKEKDKAFLTFINTENEVVISGDKDACRAIAEQLNCQTIPIPFQNIIHHDFCEKEREGLLKMHHFQLPQKPAIDFYSSITQSEIELDSLKVAENSTAVCCRQVDFPKTVRTVYEAGARIFIELGANATCTGWIKEILKGEEHLAVAINQKGKPDAQSILELLAQLASHGVELDLSMLYSPAKEEQKARRFTKKIIPGGARIFDLILSEENRKQFATIKRRKAKKKAVALALAAGEEESHSISKYSHEPTSIMESRTEAMTARPTARQERLGENGLRLQDYESGEQLKGKTIIFSQEDLEEFATGSIANVFGPEYA